MPIVKKTYKPVDENEIEYREEAESLRDVYSKPTLMEITTAAFRKENSLISLGQTKATSKNNFQAVEGYDALGGNISDIQGYEYFATDFMHSESPEETAAIKMRIDKEFEDRAILEDAGLVGVAAQMAAGLTDPIYLALSYTGIGAWAKNGKTVIGTAGRMAATGLVSEVVAETAKQATQKTRTLEESLINVGGATILSGILGGTIKGLSKGKASKIAASIDDAIKSPEPKMTVNGDIKASSEVYDLVNVGKIEQWGVSPLIRTQTSPNNITKRIASEMMETPLVSKGNIEGIATAPTGGAAETRIKLWDGPLANSLENMDRAYAKYRKSKPTTKLSYQEFREQVGRALRRGDQSEVMEIAETARSFRKNVFNPLKELAVKIGLLPEGVQVETAVSYLTRVYNVKRIIANRPKWDAILKKWLKSEQLKARLESPGSAMATLEDADLDDVIDQITDNIIGTSSGKNPYNIVSLGRGPLKERVLNIADEEIEDFLESDIDIVSRAYVRTMAPDVELTKMFGTTDMEDQIDEVITEWNKKIREATTEKQKTKYQARKEADIRDIEAMRDRLLGTYRLPNDPNSFFVRAGKTIRDINYVRMLGGMTLSAIPDAARTITVNGLKPVAKGLKALALSPKTFKLAKEEAKKAAVGLDMVLNSRASTMAEINDIYARGTRFERALRKTSDLFSKIALMSQWNSAMKQFSGVVTSDRFLTEALNIASGKGSKNAIRRMAQAGIGKDMAKKIAGQFSKYGDDGTIKLSNAHLWDNKEAYQTFKAAILKDVDRTIVTPGHGEKPLWTSTEMGKQIFQFKTFAAAAHHKVFLADLQHADAAALNGFLLSVALGFLTYGLKNYVAGREISNDPAKIIVESLDRSGAFGYLWDANNILEKASRGTVGVNALIGGDPMSRYVSRNVAGALFGPTIGTAEDIVQVSGGIVSGEFTKSDLRTLRKLLPAQNLFYTRQLLNALEEKIGEGLE